MLLPNLPSPKYVASAVFRSPDTNSIFEQHPMQFGLVTGAIVGTTAAAYMYADVSANMADEGLHPPSHPWPHSGPLDTFDHAS